MRGVFLGCVDKWSELILDLDVVEKLLLIK